MKKVFLLILAAYRRFISPMKKPCCIYSPSCSTYAVEAIERFGAVKGGFLSIRRILRCHPFHEGGYDPVPDIFPRRRDHGDPRISYKNVVCPSKNKEWW
ncbi:MAG: membrane protein insertion efficiency factor YidD [Eubacterium sp.]|nr:membrane protein insertion efficiency factor YidD [Eubacterium sp.]